MNKYLENLSRQTYEQLDSKCQLQMCKNALGELEQKHWQAVMNGAIQTGPAVANFLTQQKEIEVAIVKLKKLVQACQESVDELPEEKTA